MPQATQAPAQGDDRIRGAPKCAKLCTLPANYPCRMPHPYQSGSISLFLRPAARSTRTRRKRGLFCIFVVSTESRNSLDLAATWLTTSSLLTTLGSWRLLTWRYDSVCDIRYAVFDFFSSAGFPTTRDSCWSRRETKRSGWIFLGALSFFFSKSTPAASHFLASLFYDGFRFTIIASLEERV